MKRFAPLAVLAALAVVAGCRTPNAKLLAGVQDEIAVLGSLVEVGGPPMGPADCDQINARVAQVRANVERLSK